MVNNYFERLSDYAIEVMGRATCEFGYGFGLEPGDNPYPNMRTLVLSKSITLPGDRCVEIIRTDACDCVRNLKKRGAGLIDEHRFKRPAILLGGDT